MPVLAHNDPNTPADLTKDASSTGLGFVLSIIDSEGVERPVYLSVYAHCLEQNNIIPKLTRKRQLLCLVLKISSIVSAHRAATLHQPHALQYVV